MNQFLISDFRLDACKWRLTCRLPGLRHARFQDVKGHARGPLNVAVHRIPFFSIGMNIVAKPDIVTVLRGQTDMELFEVRDVEIESRASLSGCVGAEEIIVVHVSAIKPAHPWI